MKIACLLRQLNKNMLCWIAVIVSLCTIAVSQLQAHNIGLAIVATGRYIEFVPPLIDSAEKYFCKNHNVTYYVFTDQHYDAPEYVICLPHKRLGWPDDTMMRYQAYYDHKESFANEDYIFAIDADMLFVDDVGDKILSDHTAVKHPGYVKQRGTYETNPESTACVRADEGKKYFCGGVYGGSKTRFFHICETILSNIQKDKDKGIIAVWHDESHWNRYCIDYQPSRILSPSYCYPDDGKYAKYHPRILALTKRNVQKYRTVKKEKL